MRKGTKRFIKTAVHKPNAQQRRATVMSDDDKDSDASKGDTDKEQNDSDKDEPTTPYSLRRRKATPDEERKLNSTLKAKPRLSRSNSTNTHKVKDSDSSSDEKQKYALRPRSEINYREPDMSEIRTLEKLEKFMAKQAQKPKPRPQMAVIMTEVEGRPGLRPRKLHVKTSEIHKYKNAVKANGKSKKRESEEEDDSESEEEMGERRVTRTQSTLMRRSTARVSESDEGSGSDSKSGSGESGSSSGSESGSNSESESESGSGDISSEGNRRKTRQSKKVRMKKAESPKKSEVRRSKRARIIPKRFDPLAEKAAANGNRARFPILPRTWSGEGGGGGGGGGRGRSSRYYSRLGYDSTSSDDDDLPNLPSLRMGASIPQPLNLPRASLSASHKADTLPVIIDKSVSWDSVGGLNYHIQQLKEMILLPLLYPEVFSRFNVAPPKGVLFYGPPGTGKTLVARALANSCSDGGKKVSFFMRKGADCLSKWVGEAERQLRLLFEQAKNMQPAIVSEFSNIATKR